MALITTLVLQIGPGATLARAVAAPEDASGSALALLNGPARDWEFFDAKGHAISREQLMAGGLKQFAVRPRHPKVDFKQTLIRVRILDGGKIGMEAYDGASHQAIARTVIAPTSDKQAALRQRASMASFESQLARHLEARHTSSPSRRALELLDGLLPGRTAHADAGASSECSVWSNQGGNLATLVVLLVMALVTTVAIALMVGLVMEKKFAQSVLTGWVLIFFDGAMIFGGTGPNSISARLSRCWAYASSHS